MIRARLVGVMVLGGAMACRPSSGRERRDFERMRQQQRYDVYEPSRFFANGAVLQAPPAHTIARNLTSTQGDASSPAFLTGVRGGADVAEVPMPVDTHVLSLGAAQFAISCAPCHGAGGFGGGIMAPNLRQRLPPSLRLPPVSTLAPGTMFKVITNGVGRMPPYGWQMPIERRWAVVAYVRALTTLPVTDEMREDSTLATALRSGDSSTLQLEIDPRGKRTPQ